VSVAGAREARSIFEEALRIDHTNVDVLMGLVETHLWEVNAYMSQRVLNKSVWPRQQCPKRRN
jgi:hypothetical protein